MYQKSDRRVLSGQSEELKRSQELIHLKGSVPLLISSKLLRARNMGQVDLAVIKKNSIILWEIKIKGEYLHHAQWQRLKDAQHFISQIFGKSTILRWIGPDDLLE
jgi:hypothetical protein